jgi:hypothetical protein
VREGEGDLYEVKRAGLVGQAVADGEEGGAEVQGEAPDDDHDEVAAQPDQARRPIILVLLVVV